MTTNDWEGVETAKDDGGLMAAAAKKGTQSERVWLKWAKSKPGVRVEDPRDDCDENASYFWAKMGVDFLAHGIDGPGSFELAEVKSGLHINDDGDPMILMEEVHQFFTKGKFAPKATIAYGNDRTNISVPTINGWSYTTQAGRIYYVQRDTGCIVSIPWGQGTDSDPWAGTRNHELLYRERIHAGRERRIKWQNNGSYQSAYYMVPLSSFCGARVDSWGDMQPGSFEVGDADGGF